MSGDRPPLPPRLPPRPEWMDIDFGKLMRELGALSEATARLKQVSHQLKDTDEHIAKLSGRISELERKLDEQSGGPFRAKLPSSHDWDKDLVAAGHYLSLRVKDKNDPLDADEARKLAKEVFHTLKIADDANAFRKWKLRGGAVIFEVVKLLVAAAVGAAVVGVKSCMKV